MAGSICRIDDCQRPMRARGWCSGHYARWHHHGDPQAGRRLLDPIGCSVEGCEHEAAARGWCKLHYGRWRRHGDPEQVLHQAKAPIAWLDVSPIVELLRSSGRPLAALLVERDRRTFYRAKQSGRINDVSAERILYALGTNLEAVYGPGWDEEMSA